MRFQSVYALGVITVLALVEPTLAQEPRKPEDVPPVFDRLRDDAPRSKSDAHRLVGKVVDIDRAQGSVTLDTDEGKRVVKPSPQLLAAIRVGDTISVPRPGDSRSGDAPVSASPRMR